MKKVAVVMGSSSDLPIVTKVVEKLNFFEIPHEKHIMSAHKSPKMTIAFAEKAEKENFGVIIAAAGMAAHLAGIIAAHTTIPVIGLPINCSLNGLDALFSTVQMPKGVPVLTVGIDCAENAAIAACEILSLGETSLKNKLKEMKKNLENEIISQNEKFNFLWKRFLFWKNCNKFMKAKLKKFMKQTTLITSSKAIKTMPLHKTAKK